MLAAEQMSVSSHGPRSSSWRGVTPSPCNPRSRALSCRQADQSVRYLPLRESRIRGFHNFHLLIAVQPCTSRIAHITYHTGFSAHAAQTIPLTAQSPACALPVWVLCVRRRHLLYSTVLVASVAFSNVDLVISRLVLSQPGSREVTDRTKKTDIDA